MGMKNIGGEFGHDRHADKRDRKRDKRVKSSLMRGNRSVFEIQKAIVKRGRQAREKGEK